MLAHEPLIRLAVFLGVLAAGRSGFPGGAGRGISGWW